MQMLTGLVTQSGSSVWKWSPRRRTATAWVTRGDLHLRARALSLHAIPKAGRAFSFVSGAKVFQMLGRSSVTCTLSILYREEACKYHLSARSFFLAGAAWADGWLCMMYVGGDVAGPEGCAAPSLSGASGG